MEDAASASGVGGGGGSESGSVSDDAAMTAPPLVYDLGPPLPLFSNYEDPADDAYFPSLVEALQLRVQRRQAMRADLQRRQDAFRGQLADADAEMTNLRGRVVELEAALAARDKENARLRKRLQQMETSASALKKNHAEAVQQKKELESEVETKGLRIKQEKDSRRRLQEEMASKMQVWEKHMSSKFQQELRKQAERHEVEKRAQCEKFMALKEIINSDDPRAMLYAVNVEAGDDEDPLRSAALDNAGVAVEKLPHSTSTASAKTTPSSTANNNNAGGTPGGPLSHVKNLVSNLEARGSSVSSSSVDSVVASSASSATAPKRPLDAKGSSSTSSVAGGGGSAARFPNRLHAGAALVDRGGAGASKSQPTPYHHSYHRSTQRSQSPPPSASGYNVGGKNSDSNAQIAAAAAARRRSRSTGNNVWLDHRPAPSADCAVINATDAILQPKISGGGEKRVGRKSLTRIDAKDVEKATKYALTEQRLDSDGEIETKVFKGDVLPSRGGGSEVKLTDVEIHKIRQISPGSKRSYSTSREPTTADQVEEVESRCNIAIEGHAQPKAKRNYDNNNDGDDAKENFRL